MPVAPSQTPVPRPVWIKPLMSLYTPAVALPTGLLVMMWLFWMFNRPPGVVSAPVLRTRPPLAAISSTPAVTVVEPLYALVFAKVCVPAPTLLMDTVPLRLPEYVLFVPLFPMFRVIGALALSVGAALDEPVKPPNTNGVRPGSNTKLLLMATGLWARALALESRSTPPVAVVAPVKAPAPWRISVPLPVLFNPAAAVVVPWLIAPAMIAVI